MNTKITDILSQINALHKEILAKIDEEQCTQLCTTVLQAKKIFLAGVGREGMSLRAFAMRLMHLGLQSYWVWDDTTPAMGDQDVLVIVNGSGNIGHLNYVAEKAKRAGALIFLITATSTAENTALSKYADKHLIIPGGAYNTGANIHNSVVPMGTLFEEVSLVVYDAVVAYAMRVLNMSESDMSDKHRNVE